MMMLKDLASKLGIKVVPLGVRGEVMLYFPSKLTVAEFTLRLSTRKATALLLWILFYANERKKTEEV
jgi:hypothetical protein